MPELVSVADQMYERQGFKYVQTADGNVKNIPPGQRPDPSDELLARDGEPNFQVSLASPVQSDQDVPDAVGFALRRVADRLPQVMRDGKEVSGEQGNVEGIIGPAILDGALVLYLDTDDSGCNPAMIDTMVAILREELTPLGVEATISVAPPPGDRQVSGWQSSEERSQT